MIDTRHIHHHSSTYDLSFSVTLDPNESMPAPSRRNVLFSGTMLTLVCPFMYIYTWASIHTTSIFKTSTEVLSIVLHTSSRNTQPCIVCRLKGKTLLLPYVQGEERPNIVSPVAHHPAAPAPPAFTRFGFFGGEYPCVQISRRPQPPQADRQNSCWLPRVLEALIWL